MGNSKKKPSTRPPAATKKTRPAPAVVFTHHYRRLGFPRSSLRALAQRIYHDHGLDPAQQTKVILCSDWVIRRLNARFRNIDRPTDVLSFVYDDPDLKGEIYISLQRAAVQARRYGHTHNDEVRRLFVHGMIHLLGFDHERDTDRRRMETEESRYCML
jgi:probable rRNA maturation factor